MNKQKLLGNVLVLSIISLAFLGQTTEAQAWYWDYWNYEYHHTKSHRHKKHHHKKYHHKKYHHKKYHYKKHHHKKHDQGSYGKLVFSLPHGSISIKVGGSKYHYHNGHYYHKRSGGYAYIPAPIGACIARLPRGHDTVYVNGVKYYVYGDTYYRHTKEGYLVVPEPVRIVETVHFKSTPSSSYYNHNAFTINIPNYNGGYTPVTLTRSGDGFVGPQGEYYSSFPRVEQLKILYGSS